MRQLVEEVNPGALRLELSSALAVFALVILVGIFGLAVVVGHRQKRKRQLKALLRAKNLGPFLSSREIALGIGSKYLHSSAKRSSEISLATSTVPTLPSRTPSSAPPPLPAKKRQVQPDRSSATKKVDVNDLLSGILYRSRKGDYTTSVDCARSETPMTQAATNGSFYYRRDSTTSSADIKSSMSDDDAKSYVSKISQQVFVVSGVTTGHSTPTRSRANSGGEMNFFSSVSQSKKNRKKLDISDDPEPARDTKL